jgi:hypothetical protein
MSVKFFVPASSANSDLETVLKVALDCKPMAPFDVALVEFVNDFAKSILLDKNARAYPELIVLANFFKSANILKLRTEIEGNCIFVPRGLVFHMAPSNVDSVFLYSSFLSLLCGNVNLIRISRESGDQVKFIIDKLANLLAKDHSSLANRFFVLTYDHDDAITTLISQHCHMRVVWGGDLTVNKIRALPLRPTASELCFPDRFSAAMLSSESVLSLDNKSLSDLCTRFFNDSIWFAQQACSSPRLVSWIGKEADCNEARQRFWHVFNNQLPSKGYENSPGMVMDRFVTSCMVATDSLHRETTSVSFPTRILLDSQALTTIKHYHCGNGLFYEQCFDTVPQFFQTLSDREQTLSVFGFEAVDMAKNYQSLSMRSVDRITKIGNALDFGYVWDGFNLLHQFTRQIAVQL